MKATPSVIRYNISQNDRARLFHMADKNENIKIYNNVFFVGKGSDVQLFLWTGEQATGSRAAQIVNNIFYLAGIGRNVTGVRRKPIDDGTFFTKPGFGGDWNIVFERNVIFGNFQDIPDVWKKMTNDPKLVAPGTGANGRDSLDGYKLRTDSPCIGRGIPVKNNGSRDFWGNKIPDDENPAIGADERR